MPTIFINPNVGYFYTDSGVPPSPTYDTIIFIHGHTFHGGIFQRLFEESSRRGLRILAINRRAYPGTTPYSKTEMSAIESSSEDAIQGFLLQQGIDLAHLVHRLIVECNLPPGRNVTICAWSLGNSYMINLILSINYIDRSVGEHLRSRVKGFIMWDPPYVCFGAADPPGSWHPLADKTLSTKERGSLFGIWVSGYWKHGDISTRDFKQLNQRNAPKEPRPTIQRMSMDELVAATCLSAPTEGPDTLLVVSSVRMSVQRRQSKKALDSDTLTAWGSPQICHLMGDANCWAVIYGQWVLDELTKSSENGYQIDYKLMKGGNHFVMWDDPEVALDVLRDCIGGDMSPLSIGASV